MMIETDVNVLAIEKSALVSIGRKQYNDRLLDYHGFEPHIMRQVWPIGRLLAKTCMEAGHDIDLAVLDAAIIFHDAKEHLKLGKRFKNREWRAASIAVRELHRLGELSSAQIAQVQTDILTTASGVKPSSKEGAILKRADNFNVGQQLPVFLGCSVNIIREGIKLGRVEDTTEGLERWKGIACTILRSNIDCDPGIEGFVLPDIDTSGIDFSQRSFPNITHLGSLTAQGLRGLLNQGTKQ